MIYTIVGTHKDKREKATKEYAVVGIATHHIYSDQIGELEPLIDATSLFGDAVVVMCLQLGEVASSKEEMIRLLDGMKNSKNVFIIDEPFADVHLVNKLTKVSKKVIDAREEKLKDASIFDFCNAFIVRDKKQTWIQFMRIKKADKGEAIAGALWWKFQTEWSKVRDGKRSLFSEEECERVGGEIVRASILAHRGEKDLCIELERIVLSI